jgi:hypothetical protein
MSAPILALGVTTSEGNGFFHLKLWTRVILEDDRIEAPQYEHATVGGLYVADFTISAQGHGPSQGSAHSRLYAFEHGYDVTLVTATLAPKMARTLATLERRLAKLYATRGNADTFAEYVSRIAECLGVTEFLEIRQDKRFEWGSDRYRRMSLADGRYLINARTAEWIARITPSAPSQIAEVG